MLVIHKMKLNHIWGLFGVASKWALIIPTFNRAQRYYSILKTVFIFIPACSPTVLWFSCAIIKNPVKIIHWWDNKDQMFICCGHVMVSKYYKQTNTFVSHSNLAPTLHKNLCIFDSQSYKIFSHYSEYSSMNAEKKFHRPIYGFVECVLHWECWPDYSFQNYMLGIVEVRQIDRLESKYQAQDWPSTCASEDFLLDTCFDGYFLHFFSRPRYAT